MPCGQYCYQRKWQCQGGRLRQLTNVQKQPGPTRNYGSEGARENSIRRRVMSVKTNGSKTNYGPLFGGKKKPSVFSNCGYCGDRSVEEGKNVYYNNGGTSSTNTYWNKIAVGPKGTSGSGLGCGCCVNGWTGGVAQLILVAGDPAEAILPGQLTGWTGNSFPTRITQTSTGATAMLLNTSNNGTITSVTLNIQYEDQCPPDIAVDFEVGGSPNDLVIEGGNGTFVFGSSWAVPSEEGGPGWTHRVPSCPNRLCGGTNGTTLLGGAPCSIGGKNWLNYRRFHPAWC